jgi:hypothetical protein
LGEDIWKVEGLLDFGGDIKRIRRVGGRLDGGKKRRWD